MTEREQWERTVEDVYNGNRVRAISCSLKLMSIGAPPGSLKDMLEIFADDLKEVRANG